jgi:hypothetical protein
MKRLLLVALMVLVSLVGMVGFSRAAEDPAMQSILTQLKNIQQSLDAVSYAVSALQASAQATVNTGVPSKAKMYYITAGFFTGGEAITACDSGFHIGSLSEIQDSSRLLYAPRLRPAYNSDNDEASFKQTLEQFPDHTGWVQSEADPLTGLVYNCDAWGSSSEEQSGVTMMRRSLRGEKGRSLYESDPAAWWQLTRKVSCSIPEHVWCVEDPDEHSATKTSQSTQ